VLRWHRELVRRKWTFGRSRAAGRPPLAAEREALVRRLAAENGRWGHSRIHGEPRKPGYAIGRSAVRGVRKRHRVAPVPQRGGRASTWRQFLSRHRDALLACDFFPVQTLSLQTISALFFPEVGTRRVRIAGGTAYPTAAWVTQQARPLCWSLQERDRPLRFVLRDRDGNSRRRSTPSAHPRGWRSCAPPVALRMPTPTPSAGSAQAAMSAGTICPS
jgi:hypothetical protein